MMQKLVLIFPGAGYGIDSPLLYYADFLFETKGYERKYMDYQNIVLNRELSIDEKKNQIREYVCNEAKQMDLRSYEEIVFISKSIGTVEAGWLAETMSIDATQVYLTPVEETLKYLDANSNVVIGTRDKAYNIIKNHCDNNEINALYIVGGNHSLEVDGKPYESIEVLKQVIQFIDR